jgi:hypothetical protein
MPSPLNGVCAKLNTVVGPGVRVVIACCTPAGCIVARGLALTLSTKRVAAGGA